jgi:hypothetical protein
MPSEFGTDITGAKLVRAGICEAERNGEKEQKIQKNDEFVGNRATPLRREPP